MFKDDKMAIGSSNFVVNLDGTMNIGSGNFKVEPNGNTTIGGILDFSKLKINNSIISGLLHVDPSGNISTIGLSDGRNTNVGFNALKSNNYELITSDIEKPLDIWNGYSNSAFGYESLNTNTSGSYNTAMGYKSLYNNTSGLNNTALGNLALYKNKTGNNNTAIGIQADVSGVDLINATAIGANAIVDSSNCIQLGNPDVKKINTSGIIYTKSGLNINNSNFSVDSSGNTQTRGTFAVRNEDASFNTTYGTNNAFYVDTSGNTQITGILSVKGNASVNSLKISNLTTVGIAHIDTSGNVSSSKINTNDLEPNLKNLLSVNPTFGTVTAESFNATSDYRVKENVQQLDPTLFNVDKLNPVTYNKIDSGKQDIGFIAHEVQEVFPFLVTGEKDGEHTQSLNYLGLIGVLVKEIQELKKRIAILEP